MVYLLLGVLFMHCAVLMCGPRLWGLRGRPWHFLPTQCHHLDMSGTAKAFEATIGSLSYELDEDEFEEGADAGKWAGLLEWIWSLQ